MQHPTTRPHWRCPWFYAGLAAGLVLGLWLTEVGFEQQRQQRPPFAVISAEPAR